MSKLPRWYGCAVGAAGVALAALIRSVFDTALNQDAPLLSFVLPIVFAAAIGGMRSGLVTTGLAVVVGVGGFIPRETWGNANEIIRFALFLAVGGSISWMAQRLRGLQSMTDEQRQALAGAETYRGIVEEGAAYICRFLPDGTLTFVNEAYCRCFGRPRPDLIGSRFAVPTPDPVQAVLAPDMAPFTHEMAVTFDGAERWHRWTYRAVCDATGRFVEYQALGTDVTQERAAESARAASERRYRLLLEGVPQLVWTCLPDGRCDFLSRQWVEYTGIPEAEQLGYGWTDAVHPDDRAELLEAWNESVRTRQALDVDFRIRGANGGYRWFKTRAVLYYQDDGTTKWFGTNTDVHDKRLAAEQLHEANARLEAKVADRTAALAESERRFKAIFHSQFQFIGLMTIDGSLIEANRTALAAVGVPESDVLNRPFWETAWWTHDIAQQERLKCAIATAAGGTQVRFESHYPKADGGLGWVDFSLTPFRDETGRVVLLIPEGRDITERRGMEAALRENEERLRMATAVAGVGVWEWHIPTGRVRWNEQMFAIYSLPHTSDGVVTYETWSAAVLPEDLPDQEAQLRATVARLGTGTRTFRVRLPDGRVRDIEAFETVRPGAGGAAEWMVGTNLDVTDRKRAEERLRAQEALLRQFIRHSPAAVAMLDTEMRYLQASNRWLTDYGLIDRDIIGRSHYEVFPDLPEQWKQVHRRVLAGSVERCDEDPFPRSDGSTVWLQWECQPWYQPGGVIGGVIMFTQVITARKLAEAELRASEARFRAFMDHLPLAAWVADAGGRVRMANPFLARMMNREPGAILGKTRFELIDPESAAAHGAADRKVLETGEALELEESFLKPDGAIGTTFSVKFPVTGTDGAVSVGGVALDVTDRKRAEERVQASLREKELLLKEIHHRVKNNLQIVSTLLDLQSDFTQDRAALTMFAESRGRVKSMALIHERLYKSHDVARVDFGEYAGQLAGDLYRAYRASDEDVRLVVDVTAPPLPLDLAIPCGLLLNELMSNCFKHAFAGGRAGTLRVELTASGDARELVVADDGPGLPPGFDFRNSSSFGLQLVGTLVDQLNGTIDVRGPGTAFVVRFRTSGELTSRV